MAKITFKLNGETCQAQADANEKLLDFLRGLSLTSVKCGCREGDCGMCTVLLDGRPVRSCMLTASMVQNREITTLEGLAQSGELHPLQDAFIETDGVQCGFCTPAQILTAKALLDQNANPTDDEVREALSGVLCRCTGICADRRRRTAGGGGAARRRPRRGGLAAPGAAEELAQIRIPEDYLRHNGEKLFCTHYVLAC